MTNEIYIIIIEDRKFRSVRFCVCVLHRDRFLDMCDQCLPIVYEILNYVKS